MLTEKQTDLIYFSRLLFLPTIGFFFLRDFFFVTLTHNMNSYIHIRKNKNMACLVDFFSFVSVLFLSDNMKTISV